MTNLPKRRNFNLCELSFKQKPYCNQMGGATDIMNRFCDVCKKSWKFMDGYIVETTRKEYKIGDLAVGSKWMLGRVWPTPITIMKVDVVHEYGEEYATISYSSGQSVSKRPLKWIKSELMPIICEIPEEEFQEYLKEEKEWEQR